MIGSESTAPTKPTPLLRSRLLRIKGYFLVLEVEEAF